MSRLKLGHSMASVLCTLATPQEYYNATGTALTTSEPATGQFSYTVQESDLPTMSDENTIYKLAVQIYAGGKNADTGYKYVYARLYKNGSLVGSTANSYIAANNYYTFSIMTAADAVVGDVFEVRLWSTSVLCDWRYSAFMATPLRWILGGKLNRLLLDVHCEGGQEVRQLTQGILPTQYAGTYLYFEADNDTYNINSFNFNSRMDYTGWRLAVFAQQSDLQVARGEAGYGDNALIINVRSSSTQMPSYYIVPMIKNPIYYRPTNIFL